MAITGRADVLVLEDSLHGVDYAGLYDPLGDRVETLPCPDGRPEAAVVLYAGKMPRHVSSFDVQYAAPLSVRPPQRFLVTMPQAGAGEGEKQELGFVGLGYMGAGMVRRLLGGGHRVVVWNRR